MYKPRGYITSRSDPQQRPTVIDLLAKGGVREYVYPVGRLDYDSEGLLILTSDGALAEKVSSIRWPPLRRGRGRSRPETGGTAASAETTSSSAAPPASATAAAPSAA